MPGRVSTGRAASDSDTLSDHSDTANIDADDDEFTDESEEEEEE